MQPSNASLYKQSNSIQSPRNTASSFSTANQLANQNIPSQRLSSQRNYNFERLICINSEMPLNQKLSLVLKVLGQNWDSFHACVIFVSNVTNKEGQSNSQIVFDAIKKQFKNDRKISIMGINKIQLQQSEAKLKSGEIKVLVVSLSIQSILKYSNMLSAVDFVINFSIPQSKRELELRGNISTDKPLNKKIMLNLITKQSPQQTKLVGQFIKQFSITSAELQPESSLKFFDRQTHNQQKSKTSKVSFKWAKFYQIKVQQNQRAALISKFLSQNFHSIQSAIVYVKFQSRAKYIISKLPKQWEIQKNIRVVNVDDPCLNQSFQSLEKGEYKIVFIIISSAFPTIEMFVPSNVELVINENMLCDEYEKKVGKVYLSEIDTGEGFEQQKKMEEKAAKGLLRSGRVINLISTQEQLSLLEVFVQKQNIELWTADKLEDIRFQKEQANQEKDNGKEEQKSLSAVLKQVHKGGEQTMGKKIQETEIERKNQHTLFKQSYKYKYEVEQNSNFSGNKETVENIDYLLKNQKQNSLPKESYMLLQNQFNSKFRVFEEKSKLQYNQLKQKMSLFEKRKDESLLQMRKKLEQTTVNQEEQTLINKIKSLEDAIKSKEKQIQSQITLLKAEKKKAADANLGLDKERKSNKQLTSQITTLKQKQTKAQSKLVQFQAASKKLNKELAEERAKRQNAENNISDMEKKVKQLKDETIKCLKQMSEGRILSKEIQTANPFDIVLKHALPQLRGIYLELYGAKSIVKALKQNTQKSLVKDTQAYKKQQKRSTIRKRDCLGKEIADGYDSLKIKYQSLFDEYSRTEQSAINMEEQIKSSINDGQRYEMGIKNGEGRESIISKKVSDSVRKLVEQVKENRRNVNSQTVTINSLTTANEQNSDEIKRLKGQLELRNKQIEKLRKQFNILVEDNKVKQQKITQLSDQKEKSKKQIDDQRQQTGNLTGQLKQKQGTIKELSNKVIQKDNFIRDLSNTIKIRDKKIGQLQRQITLLKDSKAKLVHQGIQLRQNIKVLEDNKMQLEDEIKILKEEKKLAKYQIKELQIKQRQKSQSLRDVNKTLEIFKKYVSQTEFNLFPKSIFVQQLQLSNKFFLFQHLQALHNKGISAIRLVSHAHSDAPEGWIAKLDFTDNLLILIKLNNGHSIAAFTQITPLSDEMRKGFMMSATNMRSYPLRKKYEQKRLISKDEMLIIGNNELVIEENLNFYVSFSKPFCYFESAMDKIVDFIGQENEQGKCIYAQFYEINFRK